MGSGHTLGERGGEQAHTLSIAELPQHTHIAQASATVGGAANPDNAVLASASNVYRTPDNLTGLNPNSITSVGGSQAHLNMQPFLALNFCIALQGIFPSRN
jgi:microcystin-dependent protein